MSPGTAAAAYAELKRRGVVLSRPRSGMRVADRSRLMPAAPPPAVPESVRDLRLGNPDPSMLPDLGKVLRKLDPAPRLYGAETIDPALRAVAAAALAEDGIDAAHLCVLNGAMDAIERVLAAHLAPGDAVAVEDPGFPAVFDAARALGLRLVPITGGRIPDGVRAAVVTPRGQNPTGRVLDPRLRVPPGVLLIEDDHLGPAAGVPARTLSAGRERWAAVRSVSKWLGPDLRLAVLAGDAATVTRVAGRQALGPGWVSTLIQRSVAALWSDDDALALAEQAATVYTGRRRALIEALATHGIAAEGRERPQRLGPGARGGRRRHRSARRGLGGHPGPLLPPGVPAGDPHHHRRPTPGRGALDLPPTSPACSPAPAAPAPLRRLGPARLLRSAP